eukprot:TRINITY_DN16559_c0_g1_i1.p1 TRINITY_DN16559_c0_g1~~TRINITY_DN16559_c0_g1_i1.p1  ORF type:complete len:240 (-),score=71.75 TRINITY_DN16559_c0_g1_i1:194-913(-)
MCIRDRSIACGAELNFDELLDFKQLAKWVRDNSAAEDPLNCIWEIHPEACCEGDLKDTTYKLNLCGFRTGSESSVKNGVISINGLSAAFLGVFDKTIFDPGTEFDERFDAVKIFDNLPNVRQCMLDKFDDKIAADPKLTIGGFKLYDTRRDEVFFSMKSVDLVRKATQGGVFDARYKNSGVNDLVSSAPSAILSQDEIFADLVGNWQAIIPLQRLKTDQPFNFTLAPVEGSPISGSDKR